MAWDDPGQNDLFWKLFQKVPDEEGECLGSNHFPQNVLESEVVTKVPYEWRNFLTAKIDITLIE